MSGLDGRVALVTGAGQGIGAAIARRLAAAGASVAVNSLHPENARRTAEQLTAAGGQAVAVPGDVANPADVESFIAETESAFGPVEVLVNNAAILSMAPFTEFDPNEFSQIINVNLTGPMLCTRRVLPAMQSSRWGRIITVASIWGIIGARGATPYSASKGGLIAFTWRPTLPLPESRSRKSSSAMPMTRSSTALPPRMRSPGSSCGWPLTAPVPSQEKLLRSPAGGQNDRTEGRNRSWQCLGM
jgi:nucleoside-diphosphate-sugar epimerase